MFWNFCEGFFVEKWSNEFLNSSIMHLSSTVTNLSFKSEFFEPFRLARQQTDNKQTD